VSVASLGNVGLQVQLTSSVAIGIYAPILDLFMWHAFFYRASEVQHLIFSFDFFSEDVDQTVVVLTVVVMLVLPAGAPDLVQLGIAVVCVAFLGLSFKIVCGGFILPSFLYKPTCAG
jgi:hypothetical protein